LRRFSVPRGRLDGSDLRISRARATQRIHSAPFTPVRGGRVVAFAGDGAEDGQRRAKPREAVPNQAANNRSSRITIGV
jgi:hypothetical protein